VCDALDHSIFDQATVTLALFFIAREADLGGVVGLVLAHAKLAGGFVNSALFPNTPGH